MKPVKKTLFVLLCLFFLMFSITTVWASEVQSSPGWKMTSKQQKFLDDLERDTFNFFWNTADPQYGLVPDRYPGGDVSSVAGVGFTLTAYLVGAERHYVTREQAAERTLKTLRFLWKAPQGPDPKGVSGYKGYFYHFLNLADGRRNKETELSTIDTALLMAGVLASETYFDADTPAETEIRKLADSLYRRVEWPWAYDPAYKPLLNLGWRPESGFMRHHWQGYSEAMILYILALGSPTHPIDSQAWKRWTSTYHWDSYYNYPHVNFGPLFGHQYSHIWIDFRNIKDAYMRTKGIDYFINSARATYASQAYCIDNPNGWRGYDAKIWGLTASDGPRKVVIATDGGSPRVFYRYWARGSSADYVIDDGTIAPTAAGGSIPFAPEIAIPTLQYFKARFGKKIYGKYGFRDAFNLSYHDPQTGSDGWFDPQYLAIDQGPILLMIENYRTGFIWNLMKKNPYIKKGLERAGFEGGWINWDKTIASTEHKSG